MKLPILNKLETRLLIKQKEAEIRTIKTNMSFLTSKSAQDKLNALRSEHATLTGTAQPAPERKFLTSKTATKEIEFFEAANAKLREKLPTKQASPTKLDKLDALQNRAGKASIEGDINQASMDRFIDKMDRLESQPVGASHKVVMPAVSAKEVGTTKQPRKPISELTGHAKVSAAIAAQETTVKSPAKQNGKPTSELTGHARASSFFANQSAKK